MTDRRSARVEELLAQLTTDEKAALTAGTDTWHGTGVDRLGIRGFKVSDGPNGARGAYFVGTTSACVPCGTALASTWNVDLVERVGELLGEETRSKGADILLGPTINIHRSPLAGRNFECYSEDPYLTGRIAVAYIEGVQRAGVGTAVKHLAANDSEFERHTISSVVDERTLREITLPPFEAAIGEARSWSVMAAYNRLNGTYCSEHEFLMSCVHDEWDLPGFVISDWWSIKSTDETGRHGCDLEMPGPYKYLGPKLAEAVESGLVPTDALDGKVRRILNTMEALGVLDRPEHEADRSVDEPRHRELICAAAREAVVLLSNRDVLPLDPNALQRLAVIGPNADVAVIQGGGSSVVNPHYAVTVLDGLRARLGDAVEIVHERGIDGFRSAPPLDSRWTRPTDPSQPPHGFTVEYFDDLELGGDPIHVAHSSSARLNWLGDPWPGVRGDQFSVRLSATFVAPEDGEFEISLIAGGKGRLFIDDEQVVDLWDDWEGGTAFFGLGSVERRVPVVVRAGDEHRIRAELSCFPGLHAAALLLGCLAPTPANGIERAARAAADADAAVVVVGLNQDWETEGEDRATMSLPGRSDELVEAVAAANPNTVVLVNAGSPVEMTWSDQVGALAQMWYLGQESGNAVADLLMGDHSPSGRLPTTFPMRYEDTPAFDDYPGSDGEVHYREGVFVGYRGYDHRDVAPRFCFGHGMTYTTFEYGQPTLDRSDAGSGDVVVSVDVTNTGQRAASEVVQCYVGDPEASVPRPPRELKGFMKVHLEPGECQTIRIPLDERAFAFWDESTSAWLVEPGTFEIAIGASSRDLRGRVTITR